LLPQRPFLALKVAVGLSVWVTDARLFALEFGVAAICFPSFCDRRRAGNRRNSQRRLGLRFPCLMQCPALPDPCCLWRKHLRRQQTRKSAGWQTVTGMVSVDVTPFLRTDQSPRMVNRTSVGTVEVGTLRYLSRNQRYSFLEQMQECCFLLTEFMRGVFSPLPHSFCHRFDHGSAEIAIKNSRMHVALPAN
jgi:hypothetical protein